MLVTGADAGVDTLVLSILKSLGGHIDVMLYGACQRANSWPGDCLRNLNDGVEITGAGNGKSCFNHVDAQLFKSLGHLNLLDGVQLATGNLLAVAQRGVENKQSVVHTLIISLLRYIVMMCATKKPFTPGSEKGFILSCTIRPIYTLYHFRPRPAVE